MPTEEDNIEYLYIVLTHGGAPNIDWAPISQALDLKTGATTKRWSRLKQAMETGKNPGPSAYQFLWLCLKHSAKDKAMDWNQIAKKCGTTPGAASKRYSRMKQAFEKGDAAPATPPKGKTGARASVSPIADSNATSTPKRKRAPAATGSAKKKTIKAEEKYTPDDTEDDDGEEELDQKPNRAKASTAKPRATGTSKLKANGKRPLIKSEIDTDTSAGLAPLGYIDKTHLPTLDGTLFSSTNPTEATTFVQTDPNNPWATNMFHINEDGNDGNVNMDGYGDGEQYYDASEFIGADEEADNLDSELQASECQLCDCRTNWVANLLGV